MKKKNKAFPIFYLLFGLIVFVPTGTYANQNATGNSAAVAQASASTAQASPPIPTVPPEPVHLSKFLDVLPMRHDIPAPIGLSKESQVEAEQPENQQAGAQQ